MLNDARVRNLTLCVVHDCIALIILLSLQKLGLKTKRTVFQCTLAVIKEFIDHTCVEHFVKAVASIICDICVIFYILFDKVLKFGIQQNLSSFQKL